MRVSDDTRSTERSGLRADEPTFLIPDSSAEARCRALVAADIDGVLRSTVTIVEGGLLVPACVEQVYGDLAGVAVTCPCGDTLELTALFPGLWENLWANTYLIGNWRPGGFNLYVNGELIREQDRAALSNNVIAVWALPGEWPRPPPDSAGSVYEFVIEQGGRTTAPLPVTVQMPPPAPTLTAITPTTATLPSERLTLTGANFTAPAYVQVLVDFVLRSFAATVVSPTEVWADVVGPRAGTFNTRVTVLDPQQNSNWRTVTWV